MPRKAKSAKNHSYLKKIVKTPERKFIFNSALLIPTISTSDFHSTNSFSHSCHLIPNNGLAAFLHINIRTTHNSSIHPKEGLTLETSALKLLTVAIYVINLVDNTKLP